MIEIKGDAAIRHHAEEPAASWPRALDAVQREAAIEVSPGRTGRGRHTRCCARLAARSPFLNYLPAFAPTPFPAVICASVNDVIVHGIPGGYRLVDGDLVSIDFGAELDGWTGDAAISFVVGTADPADEKLIAVTEEALAAGIAAATEGARLGDISHAIGTLARGAGYGVPEGFGGHGIGRHMHEDPHVPNEGRPGRGMRLRRGLVLAIEPMLMARSGGRPFEDRAGRGWALKTVDGTRAAPRRAHRRDHPRRPADPDRALIPRSYAAQIT